MAQLLDQPGINIPCFATVVYTDANHSPTIFLELVGITHVLNLLKSNFCGGVELELEDVDVPVRPDCHVHPPLARMLLHLCIEATKGCKDIHHALEVPLLVRLELVRAIGKECLQAGHEAVDVLVSKT